MPYSMDHSSFALKSVMDNYTVLQELWEMASEIVHDSETRARLVGVQAA